MKSATRITQIIDVEPYRIRCQFSDVARSTKTIDLEPYLLANQAHPLVVQLLNRNYFMNVSLDEIGGLVWPNGFDFSPYSAFIIGMPVETASPVVV